MGICKLFNTKNVDDISKLPFFWAPIDFASILFEKGVEPTKNPIELAKKYNINTSDIKEHNALDDARLLRSVYNKLIK